MRICKNCLCKDFIGSNVEFDLKLIQREKKSPENGALSAIMLAYFIGR